MKFLQFRFNQFYFVVLYLCRLETCPPTNTQPKSTMEGWHRATLTVPTKITTIDANGKEIPIPPPRRKRPSQEAHALEKPKSGFKELFGQNISRRSSCDSTMYVERVASAEKEKMEQQRRSQSTANLMPAETVTALNIDPRPVVTIPQSLVSSSTTTPSPSDRPLLQRKVSRVGNKKSDKFFGENLSDCLSDEPIVSDSVDELLQEVAIRAEASSTATTEVIADTTSVATKDNIDIFIERNLPQPQNIEEIVKSATVEPSQISISDEIVIKLNECVTNELSNIEKSVESASDDRPVQTKRDSLDKKAEFLMAMLDDDILYKDGSNDIESTTTDETVIAAVVAAPRRKHSKQQEVDKLIVDAAETVVEQIEKEAIASVRAAVPQTSVDETDHYKGLAPVEEPIIVPKRRHYGHICDGDHDHSVHDHQGHDEPDTRPPVSIESQIIPIAAVTESSAQATSTAPIACPKKPKRDFALYEKSKQSSSSASPSSSPEQPKPAKRTPRKKERPSSVENLLSANLESSPEKENIPKAGSDPRRVPRLADRHDSKLKKAISSSSFLTQELMNQIVERVYGCQDPFDEVHGYDDGSTRVMPISKTTARKISTTRREVPSAIEEEVREEAVRTEATPAPSTANEQVQSVEKVETVPIAFVKSDTNDTDEITMDRRREIERALANNAEHKQRKEDTLSFIELEKLHAHPGRKQVVHTEIIHHTVAQPHIVEDIEKILKTANPDDEAISHVLDDIYKSNNSILEEFQKYLDEEVSDDQDSDSKEATTAHKIVKKDRAHPVEVHTMTTTHTTSAGEPQSVTVAYEIEDGVKKPLFVNVNGERRDSIVDVDQWFLKHNEFGDHPRRGSESGVHVGYDTKKLFPFGKLDKSHSGATEFFETKNQDGVEEDVPVEPKVVDEHSTLLKFMK